MRKKRSSTKLYIVALLIFALGLGALFYSAAGSGIDVFSVAQAREMPLEQLQAVRLFGTVAASPEPEFSGVQGARFTLEDEHDQRITLRVDYSGVVPDTFQPGIEVYIEGSMLPAASNATDGSASGSAPVFSASVLRTKCPSKYEKDNRT